MNRGILLRSLRPLLGEPDHDDRKWANFDCPFCRAENKFGINIQSGATKCFRCNSSPSLSSLFRMFGKKPPAELRIKKSFLYDLLTLGKDNSAASPVSLEHWKRLPSDRMEPGEKRALKYAKKRGADPDKWEFGVFTNSEYDGYVVFMIRDHGVPVSFQARDWTGFGFPKTLNPAPGVGVAKSELLFGLEHAQPGERLIVVEGIFDAVSASYAKHNNGVALLGKTASLRQIELICGFTDDIVIMLDPDATLEACQLYMALRDLGKSPKIVDWGDITTDPNSIGGSGCAKLIKNARVMNRADLLRATATSSLLRRGKTWQRSTQPYGQRPSAYRGSSKTPQ